MRHFALATDIGRERTTVRNRLAALARTLWTSYERKRRIRATIRTLHGLDDRFLRDIGLERGAIEATARSMEEGARHCRGGSARLNS